jgi:hypothetical protein
VDVAVADMVVAWTRAERTAVVVGVAVVRAVYPAVGRRRKQRKQKSEKRRRKQKSEKRRERRRVAITNLQALAEQVTAWWGVMKPDSALALESHTRRRRSTQ